MVSLTDQNFESEVLQSRIPVLVDFYGEWCPSCKMAAPVLEELAKEYKGKIKIGKIDVDENPKVAQEYGILSIPTVIIFKNGQKVERQVGFPGKAAYQQLIEKVI